MSFGASLSWVFGVCFAILLAIAAPQQGNAGLLHTLAF
jgi:hypothetical protein